MVNPIKKFLGYVLFGFGIGSVPSLYTTIATGMLGGIMVNGLVSLILIILGSYLISYE